MLTLISYDIADNKRRMKVQQLLKGYGSRVQRSVFECRLSGQEFTALGRKVLAAIDPATDSVRYYPLDVAAVKRITVHGVGKVSAEPTHWLV
jgi:CRISPR-associated protein Cas2